MFTEHLFFEKIAAINQAEKPPPIIDIFFIIKNLISVIFI
jgi:hypothetical protein